MNFVNTGSIASIFWPFIVLIASAAFLVLFVMLAVKGIKALDIYIKKNNNDVKNIKII